MEKKKLLSVLKLFGCSIMLIVVAETTLANEIITIENGQIKEIMEELKEHKPTQSDIEFADILSNKALRMTLDHINELLEQNKIYGENYNDMQDKARRGDLFVFVSTSMPLTALQAYVKEAVKYNAALVFKGLPKEGLDGWKELARIVEDLDIGRAEIAIQIDEEPFEEFKITSVPTIVLKQGDLCMRKMRCKTTYDKVSGNIGIRAALAQFASDGDMHIRAEELMSGN